MPSNVTFYSSVFNHKSHANVNDYYSIFHPYSLKNQTETVAKVQIPGHEPNSPWYAAVRQLISGLCSPVANLWGNRQEN